MISEGSREPVHLRNLVTVSLLKKGMKTRAEKNYISQLHPSLPLTSLSLSLSGGDPDMTEIS